MTSLTALREFKSASKLEKAAILVPLAFTAREKVSALASWISEVKAGMTKVYYIDINKGSDLFVPVGSWILKNSSNEVKSIQTKTSRRFDEITGRYKYSLEYIASEGTRVKFNYAGHTYLFEVTSNTRAGDSSSINYSSDSPYDTGSIALPPVASISCNSLKALEALKVKIEEIHEEMSRDLADDDVEKVEYNIYSGSWEEWRKARKLKRPASTVFLREGLMESILEDFNTFIHSKDRYIGLGVPYRRGYLFYGPPGTGKSSIVSVVASQFERAVYYLSLNDFDSDAKLSHAVASLKGNSILVLEDIDVSATVRDRDTVEQPKISLSALLNIIDGPATPDGLVVFMTTNRKEVLDPALIRKGRVDFEAEIGLPNWNQIRRMWNIFFPDQVPPFGEEFDHVELSHDTASFYDVFKSNLDDPEGASAGLSSLLASDIRGTGRRIINGQGVEPLVLQAFDKMP